MPRHVVVFAPDGSVISDTEVEDLERDNIDQRTANILAAVAQLNSYATTAFQREDQARNTPSLRTATAWNQSQRIAVLDTIADLCHAVGVLCNDVKWLGQQALNSTDDPDA